MTGWNTDTLAQSAGAGAITIVEGSSFCVSGQNGDIVPDLPHGMFFRDTRLISRWTLRATGVMRVITCAPCGRRCRQPLRTTM